MILALLLTGGTAVIQALLFRHLMVDCLPFKEMGHPFAEHFARTGHLYLLAVPGTSLLLTLALRRSLVAAAPLLGTSIGMLVVATMFFVLATRLVSKHAGVVSGDFGLLGGFTEFVDVMPTYAFGSFIPAVASSLLLLFLGTRGSTPPNSRMQPTALGAVGQRRG